MAKWVEVDKDILVNAIKVFEMIPMRSGVPSSDYIRIIPTQKYLEMALSSSVSAVLRINCSAELGKGPYWIDRRLLIPFVLMGDKWKGSFHLVVEDSMLKVKQGSRQAELALRADPIDGYGVWKDLSSLKEMRLTEDVKGLLIASNNCSTADPALKHLNCVYIGGQTVLATNQTVMFAGTSKSKSSNNIPFPVGIIPLLSNTLVKGVIIDKDLVMLDCGCGYVQGTVSDEAKKNFPKKEIVKQINDSQSLPLLGKIPSVRLAKMLKRLAEYLSGVKREDWQLKLEFSENKMRAVVKIRQGEFEEKMDVDGLKQEGQVEWPLELVQPVLEYMGSSSDFVKLKVDESKKTPYLLSANGINLLIARRAK